MAGPRRSEYEASNKRIGATRAALYLQQTPQGDMVVLYQEAADMQHFFEAMGLSQEPYFVWFREQVKDYNGPRNLDTKRGKNKIYSRHDEKTIYGSL